MPEPRPREAPGLRKIDEPHPIAPGATSWGTPLASKQATQQTSSQARQPEALVSITHRVPASIRERLKIAAIRLGRREQDVLAEALSRWLNEHEEESSRDARQ